MASKLRRVRKYSRHKRLHKHGFIKRMLTPSGRKVLARRRAK
ncbi:50S ribosomal protein L34 [Patescibacteria group bacterium]|nr:50S ribosomal protein L34 [Patescibacteria group bacterium]